MPKPVTALYERFLKKPPKQSRSRTVVESVLSAATELLGRHEEEEKVTLQAVAERAGVGIGSLYDYFVDRGSIFSGLVAKLTEDNLRRFEAQLAASRDEPLEVTVRGIVDLVFDLYAGEARISRVVLRVAHRAGLMPVLAESQDSFARSLAQALRERADVTVTDHDAAAYVLTNMATGVVHTRVWSDAPTLDEARLRDELTRAAVAYLRSPS